MCGIAGQLGGTDRRVPAMIAALTHRGPDGIRIEERADAELAHARLSIIDLEGGWQPLHAQGGTVIGNGEIYNYLELARDFQLTGKLATGSDYEPLLHIEAGEGEATFARLRLRRARPEDARDPAHGAQPFRCRSAKSSRQRATTAARPKRVRAASRPACASRVRSAASARRRATAAARASASSTGTRRPVSQSSIRAAGPSAAAATTGRPCAQAWITTLPKGSWREGKTHTSAAR